MTVSQLLLTHVKLGKEIQKKKNQHVKGTRDNYGNKSEAKARINPFTGRQAEVNARDDIITGCGNLGGFSFMRQQS